MARQGGRGRFASRGRGRGRQRRSGKDARDAAEDIPLDNQDEFHAARDRILLEGEDSADDDFEEDDEVFELEGIGGASSSGDSTADELGSGDGHDDGDVGTATHVDKRKTSKKVPKQTKATGKTTAEKDAIDESASEEEGWGRKKSAYYAADDGVNSSDEEARDMQEREARRLQAKARAGMTDDDFGFNDELSTELSTPETKQVSAGLPMDKPALVRHLEKTSPETLALAREWEDVAHNVIKAERSLKETAQGDPDSMSLGLLHVHHQTLLTYAATLAFYFHLRTSVPYVAHPELLREHPIMGRLVTLKHALATLEDLDMGPDDDTDEAGSALESEDEEQALGSGSESDEGSAGSWNAEELEALLQDVKAIGDLPSVRSSRSKGKTVHAITPSSKPAKTQEKAKKKPKAPKAIFELKEPEFVPSKRAARVVEDQSAFGEPSTLQATDAADKKARRRTLRFHAAKIESASARRAGARAAMGGDDDVPYPERRREAELRKAEALEKRRGKLGAGGDDLDDAEPEARPAKRARVDEESADEADEDGYYSLVASRKKEAKRAKKEEYEAERAAERAELVVDEDASGPRSLTRAILKNKGLTPHRSKSVRNPRVKKRLRFEKAKKRVASQKAVYKGGLSSSNGKYAGEQTGINSRVVKSLKLS